jgi:hypothetical protein
LTPRRRSSTAITKAKKQKCKGRKYSNYISAYPAKITFINTAMIPVSINPKTSSAIFANMALKVSKLKKYASFA